MFKTIIEELDSILDRDPAARSRLEIFLLYPGFKAVRMYRRAHRLYKAGFYNLALAISYRARKKYGIEIHPAAEIGKNLFIDHGMGVVIGETTIIGDNCTLYQNVTLGGTGKDQGKRHPTLGSNVMVGSGAKVLGPVTIGDNSAIAAGAVCLINLPENATAVGVPARVARINGKKISDTLDQVTSDDPLTNEINKLTAEINKLEKEFKNSLNGKY